MATYPNPEDWIEEIPFDVADWGDRVLAPIYRDDAERAAGIAEAKTPPEWYQTLRRRALQLERERLG